MIERIGTIRNPLTIIAMFAAIAEISGTLVLPFISDDNQSTYLWFLMVFPLLLICLFFLTLNFNHRVLYAPSDYRDEGNFLKAFSAASPLERAEKIRAEVDEIQTDPTLTPQTGIVPLGRDSPEPSRTVHKRELRSRYLLAEEFALSKLSQEFGRPVRRDAKFYWGKNRYVFDGIIATEHNVTAIEVKYFKDAGSIESRFPEMFRHILGAVSGLPNGTQRRLSLVLAVVTESTDPDQENIANRLQQIVAKAPFPVDVRVYSLDQLELDFEATI